MTFVWYHRYCSSGNVSGRIFAKYNQMQKNKSFGKKIERVSKYKRDMERKVLLFRLKQNAKDVCKEYNLIITTSASKDPIIFKDYLQPGTHVTAAGADAIEKRELGDGVLGMANTVIADKCCTVYGKW